MDKLYEINFAVSTERPPPIPTIKSELSFLTSFSILLIDFLNKYYNIQIKENDIINKEKKKKKRLKKKKAGYYKKKKKK